MALIAIYALNFLVRFCTLLCLTDYYYSCERTLKNRIFKHLLVCQPDYFTAQSTGTLNSRLAQIQCTLRRLSCLNYFNSRAHYAHFLFIYTLRTNWRLTLITLFVAPLWLGYFPLRGEI
jgi:ABC-type multidrug transport system fused ATPase/permease subunit